MIEARIKDVIEEVSLLRKHSVFKPELDALTFEEWRDVMVLFQLDYQRYYSGKFEAEKIKYFPGLIATFFYRVSRFLFMKELEKQAQEFSSLGFDYSGTEIYYSADVGQALKINHSIGTVVGARVKIGNNVLLHHNITFGDKGGGRPILGNNVVVYPGAVVVGNVTIGNNCIIGANTFVDKSYPDNSIIK